MRTRLLSLLPACALLSGCALPFPLPAFGKPVDNGRPSFTMYAQAGKRIELGQKLRGLTPYIASAEVASAEPVEQMNTSGINGGRSNEQQQALAAPLGHGPGSTEVAETGPVQPNFGSPLVEPPAPIPPCSDGTQQRLWVMEAGSDLAEGLRLWTAEAGLAGFYTDTKGWRFPLGAGGMTHEGCFDTAVIAALAQFERHAVRPKVQVDRDGFVYLSVYVGGAR